MADEMKPTPRSPILGLFSDIVNLPLQYMSSPERTQQSQGVAQFLYGTGIPKTLERMSYGDSLFSGSGMTLRPKEETINAAMNVAPFAPAAGRLASRAVRATEGLPVGMGIKDVGKNIFEDATKYHQKVPEIKSINVDKLKRMNAGEVANVSDEVAAKMDFSKPIQVSVFADGELRIVDGHHRVAAAKKLGIKSLPVELQAINAKGSTLNKLAQEATYPQQAALDLAQQRAALPVSEGGLGLPANNTPMDRARAMGFKESGYSGTSKDFINYDPSKSSGAGSGSREGPLGAWLTDDPRVASEFANWSSRGQGGDVVYPLMIRGSNPYQPSAYSEIKDILDANTQFSRPPYRMMQDKINYENAIRDLEAKGDYVALRNTLTDAIDNPITQFLVTDPTRLRSRFAAFDPFRKDVATATAMGVALPDLLAQPVNQYQPIYETTPMYTDPFGNTIGSSIR